MVPAVTYVAFGFAKNSRKMGAKFKFVENCED
jgi:hypothetical protein